MKKKVLVTAAVCALSVACIFGATACNKDDGSSSGAPDVGPSIEVSLEEWNAAFDKLGINFTFLEIGTVVMDNLTYNFTGHYYKNYAYDNNSEFPTGYHYYELSSLGNQQEGFYSEGSYGSVLRNNVWICNGFTDIDEFSSFHSCFVSLTDWAIIDLVEEGYSEFTFLDGVYSRTVNIGDGETGTIKVKINSDGYLSYLYGEGIGFEGAKCKVEYVFYDFGTTTCDVPAEAKQAIEDYKASHN